MRDRIESLSSLPFRMAGLANGNSNAGGVHVFSRDMLRRSMQ